MKRTFSILILLVLALEACNTTISPSPSPSTAPIPTRAPSATLTSVPPSPTPPPAAISTRSPSPTAAPTQSAATATVASILIGTPAAVDCAAIPGFPTCASKLALSGRLAIFNPAAQTIQLYDFGAKQALALKAGGVQKLAWQDAGNELVSYDASGKPAFAWVNPILSKTVSLPALNPQGGPLLTASDGSTAWLESKNGAFLFHVRLVGSAQEQTWSAEPQPSDKIHELLGWVPGTQLLLAGYHFGSNSMWVSGNRLYTLDAKSGAIKELNANLPLGGSFTWNPKQPNLMAFSDSNGAAQMGLARLAVLDIVTGKVTHPVGDELVSSRYPAWTADGQAILHAADKLGGSVKADDPFALAAIYLTTLAGNQTRRLTQPGANSKDDWPHPLADGKQFIYLRAPTDNKPAALYVGSIDGSLNSPVTAGIVGPAASSPSGAHWEGWIAFAP